MKRGLALMSAAGAGAGLMYLFDPDRGKRRRALLRNKAMHLKKIASNTAESFHGNVLLSYRWTINY
jgi:hypothetical protein